MKKNDSVMEIAKQCLGLIVVTKYDMVDRIYLDEVEEEEWCDGAMVCKE